MQRFPGLNTVNVIGRQVRLPTNEEFRSFRKNHRILTISIILIAYVITFLYMIKYWNFMRQLQREYLESKVKPPTLAEVRKYRSRCEYTSRTTVASLYTQCFHFL